MRSAGRVRAGEVGAVAVRRSGASAAIAHRNLLGDAVRAATAVGQHGAGHRDHFAAGIRVTDHRQGVGISSELR